MVGGTGLEPVTSAM